MPSFVGDDDTPSTFGGDQYFWGNLPAIDCLQLNRNEGMASSVTRDFNLCFSGKINGERLTFFNLVRVLTLYFDIQHLATSETLSRLLTAFPKITPALYLSCLMTRVPLLPIEISSSLRRLSLLELPWTRQLN